MTQNASEPAHPPTLNPRSLLHYVETSRDHAKTEEIFAANIEEEKRLKALTDQPEDWIYKMCGEEFTNNLIIIAKPCKKEYSFSIKCLFTFWINAVTLKLITEYCRRILSKFLEFGIMFNRLMFQLVTMIWKLRITTLWRTKFLPSKNMIRQNNMLLHKWL